MPSIRSGLRWMFLTIGLVMPMAPGLILNHAYPGKLAAVLYPQSDLLQIRFRAFCALGIMLAGPLCLLTSWGLRIGWRWAIWTGRLASLLLQGVLCRRAAGRIRGVCAPCMRHVRVCKTS